MKNLSLLFFGIFFITASAQKDTITFKNKDIMVGELKEMSSNVIVVKTPYSDSDFKITFDKIASLNLEHRYTIELANGSRLYGFIKPHPKIK